MKHPLVLDWPRPPAKLAVPRANPVRDNVRLAAHLMSGYLDTQTPVLRALAVKERAAKS